MALRKDSPRDVMILVFPLRVIDTVEIFLAKGILISTLVLRYLENYIFPECKHLIMPSPFYLHYIINKVKLFVVVNS